MPPPLRRHSSSYQEVGSGGLCNLLLTSRTREGPGSGTSGVWNLPPLEPRGHCCKGAQATVLGREKAHGQPSSGLTEALHRTESSWTRQLEVPASGLRCRTARDNPAEEPPPPPPPAQPSSRSAPSPGFLGRHNLKSAHQQSWFSNPRQPRLVLWRLPGFR